jgi:hypothetical protein
MSWWNFKLKLRNETKKDSLYKLLQTKFVFTQDQRTNVFPSSAGAGEEGEEFTTQIQIFITLAERSLNESTTIQESLYEEHRAFNQCSMFDESENITVPLKLLLAAAKFIRLSASNENATLTILSMIQRSIILLCSIYEPIYDNWVAEILALYEGYFGVNIYFKDIWTRSFSECINDLASFNINNNWKGDIKIIIGHLWALIDLISLESSQTGYGPSTPSDLSNTEPFDRSKVLLPALNILGFIIFSDITEFSSYILSINCAQQLIQPTTQINTILKCHILNNLCAYNVQFSYLYFEHTIEHLKTLTTLPHNTNLIFPELMTKILPDLAIAAKLQPKFIPEITEGDPSMDLYTVNFIILSMSLHSQFIILKTLDKIYFRENIKDSDLYFSYILNRLLDKYPSIVSDVKSMESRLCWHWCVKTAIQNKYHASNLSTTTATQNSDLALNFSATTATQNNDLTSFASNLKITQNNDLTSSLAFILCAKTILHFPENSTNFFQYLLKHVDFETPSCKRYLGK